LDKEINNYKIIKRSKLKVSFDKSWWENKMKSMGKMAQEK
jgi:hypothetical protein